jgi:chorismate mutase
VSHVNVSFDFSHAPLYYYRLSTVAGVMLTSSQLQEWRDRIDRIDNDVVRLLGERLEIVSLIGDERNKTGEQIYVPAREAEIIRRLAARIGEGLPLGTMVRMWRELLGAAIQREGNFAVGVYVPDPAEGLGLWDIARDHFGSHVRLRAYKSTQGVAHAVTGAEVQVGVLPLPQEEESDPWWPILRLRQHNTPRVVARLPFGPPGNARRDRALVIGHATQRATGNAQGDILPENDCTVFVIENAEPISPDKLFTAMSAVGLTPTLRVSAQRADPAMLIGVRGYVPTDDAKLDRLCEQLGVERSRLLYVGGYAAPLPEAGPEA